MTGKRPTGIRRHNPNSRRAQLQKMLDLQRKLDNIKACNCPDDCRGQGRDRVPESQDRNTGSKNPTPLDLPVIPPPVIPPPVIPPPVIPPPNQGGNDNAGGFKSDFLGSDLDLAMDFSQDLSDFFSRLVEDDADNDNANDNDSNQSSWLERVDSQQGAGGYLPDHVSRRAGARMRSRVLARAKAAKSITLEHTGKNGKLRMDLQVHADPQGYLTRLGYYADLFLKLDGAGEDDGPGSEERHIGYISSWRVSKEPKQYAHEDIQPWVTEWLRGDLGGPDDDSRPFKEALRLLYKDTGQVQDNMIDDLIGTALDGTGSELVFVEMIWIKYQDDTTGFQYSRQRIASHALELFYSLLNNGTLPAWYTINLPITFILRVGMPSDDGLSEMWLTEYPRGPNETEEQYSDRISDRIETVFQIERRYGYRKISNDHRIVVLTVPFPQRLRIVDDSLEDETVPRPAPKQIAPQIALSSIRL